MTPADDPFAAVTKAVADAPAQPIDQPPAKAIAPSGAWVAPVPDDAPSPRTSHNAQGQPSATWAYRDAAGRVLCYTCRFDKADGGKDILPQTLWRDGNQFEWRWKAAPAPRPLYGLDRLAAKPVAPVLIVEGEKTADAGDRRFPAYAVVTWPGGSKAVTKADWTPLQGRRVIILPDADAAGLEAADVVAREVAKAGADGVAIVALPDGLPKGWDIADALPSGVPATALAEAIGAALDRASTGTVQCPFGYRLDDKGLFFAPPGKEDAPGPEIRLSDPFEITGEARDPHSGDWALMIRFSDRDGVGKRRMIARADVVNDAGAVRARLAGDGLLIKPGKLNVERFSSFLGSVKHSARITLAKQVGWLDDRRFVLPDETIAAVDAEKVHYEGDQAALHYAKKGTLADWQNAVASRAVGNDLLLFCLSLAFCGPIMRMLDIEGGGFHIRGTSSTGKSTLAVAAGSVWGGGGALGFATSWRATGNALEGVAKAHSETVLILDELALVDPQEAGKVAYALAGGVAKARLKADSGLRRRDEWRASILSTGEISLADHMASAKIAERAMAGQELRLLDLSADAGAGLGAWQTLHGKASGAGFSDAIKAACGQHYGHAGPAFVRGVIEGGEGVIDRARRTVDDFTRKVLHEGDSSQVNRAAKRFAYVAAAGELAAGMGVVPWPARTASAAAATLFDRWAEAYGRKGVYEDRQILIQVRNVIQQHEASFKLIRDRQDDDDRPISTREGEARALKTLGYKHSVEGQECYLFHDAGWGDMLKGYDGKRAVTVLRDKGYLFEGVDKRSKRKVRTGPGNSQRFYAISARIVDYDPADADSPIPDALQDADPLGPGWD